MLPVKLGILPKRSNGLGGEVKGRWSGKQYCRQGKAVEIPVWVCLTAPTGGVASGFLRHWTGPASSTQEFQGFNIYLKTISSDMVHGLARVRTVTNMGSISFLLLLLLVLITTGFYILTFLPFFSSSWELPLSLKLQFLVLQFKWQICFYTYSCTWEFVEVATLLNALTTIRQFAGNDNGGGDNIWLFPQGKQKPETQIFFMTMEICLFWACFSLRVGARRMNVSCWSFNSVSKQKFYLKTQQGLPSAVLRLQSTLLSVIWSEHKPLAILHSSPSFAQGPQSESFDFWGLLLSDLISW